MNFGFVVYSKSVELLAHELPCPEEIAPVLRVIRRPLCIVTDGQREEGLFLLAFTVAFRSAS